MRPEWIFCGNGASDIIFRLPKAVQAKKVMVTAPTFSDYERSALSNGSEIIRYTLNPACFALDDGFIKMVRRERPCLVYVCNPNNPTGILTETGLIRELLGCCRDMGATVAVDECFLDFTEQAAENTCRFFIEEYPNLVILKAFTKLFALPGIRLGYAISSNRALINSLCFHGADWPVSNLAQAAGAAALEGAENFIKATAEYVSAQRTAVEKELLSLGYNTFDSKANYIFFQSPYRFDLYAELDKKGIRIRSCGNYHGLDNSYYRIAVSDKTSNELLVSAITDVTKRRS
jgi:threonine-phosphate decarboxylase